MPSLSFPRLRRYFIELYWHELALLHRFLNGQLEVRLVALLVAATFDQRNRVARSSSAGIPMRDAECSARICVVSSTHAVAVDLPMKLVVENLQFSRVAVCKPP